MSDDATPRLELPYLAAAQAQKHVTVNEGLARLDALVACAVESRTTAGQPETPADGVLYILPAAATGPAWSGRPAGTLMRFEAGAWAAIEPPPGLVALVKDDPALVVRSGAGWADLAALIGALANLRMLGVCATPDGYNRLVVRSPAILFDHDGSGVQLKLDKHSSGDTASVLFQTGYSGRAEIGLCGDDALHVKVSSDGSRFIEALVIGADATLQLNSFTVASLPAASPAGRIAFVADAARRATLAFADGAHWRRTDDRAVVS